VPRLSEADFTEFVRTRSAALLRTAYLLTGDRGHAEDLLQTVLAKVYASWGRIREPQAVEAYVRQALVTTATSWWRMRARRPERPAGDDVPDLGTAARTDEVDERDRLWSALLRLPARQRAVLALRFYEDLSEAQTAAVLGCAPGTVKAHTHQALRRMREVLGELGEQPIAIVEEDQ
jgi:RNA polymerase sigma-70 factor (sigma-E family)